MPCSTEMVERLLRKNVFVWQKKRQGTWHDIDRERSVASYLDNDRAKRARADTEVEMEFADCKQCPWPKGWKDLAMKDLATQLTSC
jgi:hypothetical protein